MATPKFLEIIDNALKDVFERKAADPTKARRPLLRGIDRALTQFKSGSTGTPTGWWRVRNGVVALTVKVGGDTFAINGVGTNHLPAGRFEEFLGSMRSAVEAGQFDAEIANHGKGNALVPIEQRAPRSISPEAAKARGIKAAATRKANRDAAG